MPITVTTGIRALGNAWTKIRRGFSSPLERATCMYSVFITSSIEERIMRAMIAANVVPTAIEGRMRCESQGQKPSDSGA